MAKEKSDKFSQGSGETASATAKPMAKSVELGIGLTMLGNRTTLNANTEELEVTALGIRATGKTKRVVLIPWANIRGVELIP